MNFPLEDLKKEFVRRYGGNIEEVSAYFAPGRVNLLGEHTDYNGGLVMPFSIGFGTVLLTRKRNDEKIRFASRNFTQTADVCMKSEIDKVGNSWINYPLGLFKEFQLQGFNPGGLDLLFYGNIPNGAGLSSSASIEMVTAFAINDLFGYGKNVIDMVHMAQHAENNFVGMNCGIMDMFAVGMGVDGKVIMLDCDTLDYSLVEIPIEGYVFIISDTKKERKLADSKYNERRSQCEAVVEIVNGHHPIKNLSQLSVAQWDQYKSLISDEVLRKRATHVITENQRVKDGMAALANHDLTLFGQKMNASHESLKTDYEVSCYELDVLVEAAQNVNGVVGSRMTGAGFGGCTISLLPEGSVATFKNEVGEIYQQKTGLKPAFYLAVPSDGVRKL